MQMAGQRIGFKDVVVVDDPDLPDGPKNKWPVKVVED